MGYEDRFCVTCGAELVFPSVNQNNKSARFTQLLKPQILIPSVIGVVVLVAVLGFAGGGGQKLKIVSEKFSNNCSSLNSNDTIYDGLQVTVTDGHSNVIATGAFASGVDGHDYNSHNQRVPTCTFTATVRVPSNLPKYFIRAGGSGGVTFRLEELKNADWIANIQIGKDYYRPDVFG